MNGFGIDKNQVIFVGNENYDFFMFNPDGLFQPELEELVNGEFRADWEDESDEWDESEPEGDFEGFIVDDKSKAEPKAEIEQPSSILQPIPLPSPSFQQPTLKFELSINLNISINGESIFSNQFPNQLGCKGLDSNLGARS